MRFLFILLILSTFLQAQTPKECDKLIVSGVGYMNRQDYVKSLELLTKAKAMAEKNKWHKQQFLAINNIGANYFSMLDYGEALNNYLEAYTIAIKELDENSEMIVLNNIAILYSKEKQYDKAEEYFKKAYNIANRKKAWIQKGVYAVNLGMVANEKNQIAIAKSYLDESKILLKDKPTILVQVNMALAENCVKRKDYKQAKKISFELLRKFKEEQSKENVLAVLLILSNTSHAEGDLNAAIYFAQQALKEHGSVEDKVTIYERLADLYREAKYFDLALKAKDSLILSIENLNNIKNGRLYETNRVKFEIENYQRELQENQQKLTSERKAYYSILAAALLVIVLIAWALRNSYIRSKQRKIIHDRSEKILALELENKNTDNLLMEKHLQERETLAMLEQERLKNEIENRNRKLASKALHLSNRNELIEEIIVSFSNQPEISTNQKLKAYVEQLKTHLKNDAEWESFLTHFEEVNQGFLKALKQRHPELTSNDIRFLSYAYINLSIKEISLLLNITPEACRKRKERIANKMGLPDNSDLYNYISGI